MPAEEGSNGERAHHARDDDGTERETRERSEHLLEREKSARERRVERGTIPRPRRTDENLHLPRLKAQTSADRRSERGAEHGDGPSLPADPPDPSVIAEASVRKMTGRVRTYPSRFATASCTSGTFWPAGIFEWATTKYAAQSPIPVRSGQ